MRPPSAPPPNRCLPFTRSLPQPDSFGLVRATQQRQKNSMSKDERVMEIGYMAIVNEIDGDEDVDSGDTEDASAYPPPKRRPTVRHGQFAHQGSTRET